MCTNCVVLEHGLEKSIQSSFMMIHSGHSCSMCVSTLICHKPDTYHGGDNADNKFVVVSRLVIEFQEMHILMGAASATTQYMTYCQLDTIVLPSH
jgi:hypothetical protein